MLGRVGVADLSGLFDSIPDDVRLKRPLDLQPALTESALMSHLQSLASKNQGADMLSFLGGGMYHHHIPPAVDQLLLRSEFYTAYTPYQAELSQGTLQAIFEFQTTVCELLGSEVANASMYDAASGVAEAVLMARRITRRKHCVVSAAIHPQYVETIRTYLYEIDEQKPNIKLCPVAADGRTDLSALKSALTDDTAAVIMGYPNFFGCVEDLSAVSALATANDSLLVTATAEPYALSVLQSPGTLGADICVGEGQPLAVPPQYGGPGVGLFACRQKFVRQMPGRLVGQTVDANGNRGFVLTLSTREQHIRRERATSNICTNHGLIALAMTMRTAMLGRQGFEQAGRLCLNNTEYLKKKLLEIDGVELPFSDPTFNEFVIRVPNAAAIDRILALGSESILAGVPLRDFDADRTDELLIAVTERHEKADLDRLANAIGKAVVGL